MKSDRTKTTTTKIILMVRGSHTHPV